MSAYIVIDLTIKNAEKMTEYSAGAVRTLTKYKGEFVAKGKTYALYGETHFENKAIIKFPDYDIAMAWYNSPEYQELLGVRSEGMDCKFQLVATTVLP